MPYNMNFSTFWHEFYLNRRENFEPAFDAFMEVFSEPLAPEIATEYYLPEVLLEYLGEVCERKEYEKLLQMVALLEDKQADVYQELAGYFARDLINYHAFRRDVAALRERVKAYQSRPFQDDQFLLVCMNKLAYYGHRELLTEWIRLTYFAEREEKRYINSSLKNWVYLGMIDRVFEQQRAGETVNWQEHRRHLEDYGQKLPEEKAAYIEQGYTLSTEDWAKMGKDLTVPQFLNNYVQAWQIGFAYYAKGYGLPVMVGVKTWGSLISYCDTFNPPDTFDRFFRLERESLKQFLKGESSMLFMDQQPEAIMMLWGFCYAYDFLKKIGWLSAETYESGKSLLQSLRQVLLAEDQVHLWEADFVHDWQKPDMDSEAAWEAERAAFKASFSETEPAVLPQEAERLFTIDFNKSMAELKEGYRKSSQPAPAKAKNPAHGRYIDPEELKKPKIGRNDRVTVKYQDGTRKEGVKYKTVLRDLEAGSCELVQP